MPNKTTANNKQLLLNSPSSSPSEICDWSLSHSHQLPQIEANLGRSFLKTKRAPSLTNQMARSPSLINVSFSVTFSFVTLMVMATPNVNEMAFMCVPLVHFDRHNGSFKSCRHVSRASVRLLTTSGSLAIGRKTVVTTVRLGLVLPYNYSSEIRLW